MIKKNHILLSIFAILVVTVFVSCGESKATKALNKMEKAQTEIEKIADEIINMEGDSEPGNEFKKKFDEQLKILGEAEMEWEEAQSDATEEEVKRYQELKSKSRNFIRKIFG